MATTITFKSGTSDVKAEVYFPPASVRGVVVIAYGSDGLVNNENGPWETMIRGYAEDLARGGFVALIPDYLEATKTIPGRDPIQSLAANHGTWEAVIADAIGHAKTLAPGGARVGLLGFSLGGFLCLRVRGKAEALSSYFAPFLLDGIGPADGSRLTRAELHHGEADQLRITENAKPIEAALTAEKIPTILYPYPRAGHGFVGSDPDNTMARTQSKSLTLAFFATNL